MNYSQIIEILSQRLIRPSTSTPSSLRCHNLSLTDQIASQFLPLAFFFPNQGCGSTTEMSQLLETALSKALSFYYPLAGRLRDNLYVECNDKGAYFNEARFKIQMSELDKLQNSQLNRHVCPNSFWASNDGDPSLLHVQINYFDCGGMVLSICMSHKLGDLSTLSTFAQDLTALVHQPNHIPTPQFVGVSLFPPIEDPSLVKQMSMKVIDNPPKYLVIRGPKIAELKEMVANTSAVERPTRVEVVTALLYKCALDSSRKISGTFTPTELMLPVNVRPMTVPPLPKEAVGNLVVNLVIPTPKEEEITLQALVSKIRNAKVDIKNEYKEAKSNVTPSLKHAMIQMNHSAMSNIDLYVCTSWCGFPFFDVDFGRGKPVKVYSPAGGAKNIFILRDTRNEDEIEVVAMLEEPQMSSFASNEELLAFASLIE